SNRPVEEWDEVFGDQVVAAAILDRLLHQPEWNAVVEQFHSIQS
ncbi:MAG: ATP-binding protein, partial [Cyanobium sp.]